MNDFRRIHPNTNKKNVDNLPSISRLYFYIFCDGLVVSDLLVLILQAYYF